MTRSISSSVLFAMLLALAAGSCKTGGEYTQGERESTGNRGETNGRMFDFVVNKPDGDEWTVRIRGTSMWVAHPHDEKTDDLGTVNLDDKESAKIWKKIDALDMPERKKGKKDEDAGYVQLQLREPGENDDGDAQHEIFTAFVSRDTDEDEVTGLASYLRKLVEKYHPKVKADF